MPIKYLKDDSYRKDHIMEFIIGKIASVGREPQYRSPTSRRRKTGAPKDRRRNTQDRRKNIRDGILLTLQNDQRVLRDRRRSYI